MGLWEIVLIVAVLLLLAGWSFPILRRGFGRGLEEFGKAADEVTRKLGVETTARDLKVSERLTLWLAEGFGVGRIPFAPGTFGSVIGLIWFLILLLPKSPLIFAMGVLASVFISVWLCGAGEKILGQRDPGSIVMDEIIAIPLCFGSWLAVLFFQKGFWPAPEYFFSGNNWMMTVGVFLLFRLFDVAKPRPVKQSQTLPGGWGVTIDDVLAGVYVNIVVLIVLAFQGF